MSVITPWLVIAALCLMLGAVVYISIKDRVANKKEIKRLTAELESQKRVNQELCKHAEEIAKINGDKEKVAEQIKEAKSDEEVLSIISSLARSNNERVRKQAKDKK